MCAISGGEVSSEKLEKMLNIQKHRGPDQTGMTEKGGMNRLSIIDLKSPNLCPYTEDKYTLLFNGEIFNYIELREELRALGYRFTTDSDSEVLLKAYIEWGYGCLERLNGMFAFCIYDGDTYFLARDIAGEKPLYYSMNPFKFASEAKALNFKCKELPPAHYLVFRDNRTGPGMFKLKQWWFLEPREINMETAVDELEALLADSIKIRTRSDVPYALYYSGGIDSHLISTFHDFDHKLNYVDSQSNKDEFLKLFPKILWHLDYPIKSFSAYGLWKLAEQANSKGVKVVLSGEGADELFGGYVRYVPNMILRQAINHFPSYGQYFDVPDVNMLGFREFNTNMRELLRMGDRMASAWGVENRCPYLDKRIIEFAFSLPAEAKIQGYETKKILRDLMKRRDPDYKFEEKHGLYCSVNEWLGAEDKFSKDLYYSQQQALWSSAKFRIGGYA